MPNTLQVIVVYNARIDPGPILCIKEVHTMKFFADAANSLGHINSKSDTKAKKMTRQDWIDNIQLYLLLSPVLIFLFLFNYRSLYGILIAFQDYHPGAAFLSFDGKTKWVGFDNFIRFFKDPWFFRIVRNTVWLNILSLLFVFCTPIIFALILNEVQNQRYKKVSQTLSYMPHFVSSVIVGGMVISFVNGNGVINDALALIGVPRTNLLTVPAAFPPMLTIISIWQSFGWGSILYLSNIASIDPGLYESAWLDGANRFQQMWHVTLPSMKNLIVINLIFAISAIMTSSGDMILQLYTPASYSGADVIATYIFRMGLQGGRYSMTTAIGLFVMVINFILMVVSNKITNKVADFGLW